MVEEFLAFIDGAELIIHNAAFDVGFLNAELARLPEPRGTIADRCSVLDTLAMARERYPGQRNSLDALCKRLGVDNSARELHGGLIDVQLLADVYIAMTSGQVAMDLGFDRRARSSADGSDRAGGHCCVARACSVPSADELAAHEKTAGRARQECRRRQRVAA